MRATTSPIRKKDQICKTFSSLSRLRTFELQCSHLVQYLEASLPDLHSIGRHYYKTKQKSLYEDKRSSLFARNNYEKWEILRDLVAFKANCHPKFSS
jgi:hypothetical protein